MLKDIGVQVLAEGVGAWMCENCGSIVLGFRVEALGKTVRLASREF